MKTEKPLTAISPDEIPDDLTNPCDRIAALFGTPECPICAKVRERAAKRKR